MTKSMKSLCLTAAVAGMLGGTTATVNAQPAGASRLTADTGIAGAAAFQSKEKPKHACKGMNACKGQGADGKNSCKGKGSCATDGSKPMPKM
jgi:hypothetical protein